MKNIALIMMIALSLQGAGAQSKPAAKPAGSSPSITELVSDLSVGQKRKLDALQKESKTRIDALKQQRDQVRDSIHAVLDLYGDHTREIYPLFEREQALQAEITRELYRVKVRADEILTREQHKEFTTKMKACRKSKKDKH